MELLDSISDEIRKDFDRRTKVRDQVLAQSRQLTRHSSMAIRAIHRDDEPEARQHLEEAKDLVHQIKRDLEDDPDLYFSGYTQDAIKEYCEAHITVALIKNQTLPSPQELDAEYAAYLGGLTETLGELRRRCMDILRPGYSDEVERLLGCMDEIFSQLVTMDYPDAITNGLRRKTDLARGIIERTRADITTSFRQNQLKKSMEKLSKQLSKLEN
ncbi:MAG: haloacid dehalogenase [Chloroflexota bacterium]